MADPERRGLLSLHGFCKAGAGVGDTRRRTTVSQRGVEGCMLNQVSCTVGTGTRSCRGGEPTLSQAQRHVQKLTVAGDWREAEPQAGERFQNDLRNSPKQEEAARGHERDPKELEEAGSSPPSRRQWAQCA